MLVDRAIDELAVLAPDRREELRPAEHGSFVPREGAEEAEDDDTSCEEAAPAAPSIVARGMAVERIRWWRLKRRIVLPT